VIAWLRPPGAFLVSPVGKVNVRPGLSSVTFILILPRSEASFLRFITARSGSALRGFRMKIEANPTPAQIKWLILVILIAAGLGHEQLLGLI